MLLTFFILLCLYLKLLGIAYGVVSLGVTHVLPVIVMVVTCPFQCIGGCITGLMDDMLYFNAVYELTWVENIVGA